MAALANFFSGVRSELGVRLDYKLEMEAEMRASYNGG
jgi:hypothetical protein